MYLIDKKDVEKLQRRQRYQGGKGPWHSVQNSVLNLLRDFLLLTMNSVHLRAAIFSAY